MTRRWYGYLVLSAYVLGLNSCVDYGFSFRNSAPVLDFANEAGVF